MEWEQELSWEMKNTFANYLAWRSSSIVCEEIYGFQMRKRESQQYANERSSDLHTEHRSQLSLLSPDTAFEENVPILMKNSIKVMIINSPTPHWRVEHVLLLTLRRSHFIPLWYNNILHKYAVYRQIIIIIEVNLIFWTLDPAAKFLGPT